MQRLGGAVIHMQQSLINNGIDFSKYRISYQVGNENLMTQIQKTETLEPFSEKTMEFLSCLSKVLLSDREAKAYPDVITFAFWIRRASVEILKKRFVLETSSEIKMGRGIVFHIAPSNVPVNYAYSLVVGLLCGNANIVRIPSKDFPQVTIINRAINQVLKKQKDMASYIILLKYGHDSLINDALSTMADVRVVWGGDTTINELRKSVLRPRATEITFADRYSMVVIDSDKYMEIENKIKIANDFYNDTFLTDQNACTSPRAVIWMGNAIADAQKVFWRELHKIVDIKYDIQGVQAVNKLTSGFLLAVMKDGIKKEQEENNLIVRMKVENISADMMNLKDNSGYFFEYNCKNILELKNLCNDTKCQTISYIGDKAMLLPLIKSGVKGIDRIVSVGKTMDFDMIWDGYNLFERMTRSITIG